MVEKFSISSSILIVNWRDARLLRKTTNLFSSFLLGIKNEKYISKMKAISQQRATFFVEKSIILDNSLYEMFVRLTWLVVAPDKHKIIPNVPPQKKIGHREIKNKNSLLSKQVLKAKMSFFTKHPIDFLRNFFLIWEHWYNISLNFFDQKIRPRKHGVNISWSERLQY